MRRTILIILFSLMLFSISKAQLIEEYGIKIGGTISNQNWDYSDFNFETEYLLGFSLGIFGEILNTSDYCLVIEANIVQKGMREDEDGAMWRTVGIENYATWETRINYLNISILAKYNLDFNSIKPYLLFGPKIDYEINKSFSSNYTPIVESEFSKLRAGIKIGIGSDLNFVSENLFLELLYDRDFNPLYDNGFVNINSYSFNFCFGFYF